MRSRAAALLLVAWSGVACAESPAPAALPAVAAPAAAPAPPALLLEGVRLAAPPTAPSAGGPPSVTVQAQRARWDLKAGEGHFEGEVQVQRGPLALRCDRLSLQVDAAGVITAVLGEGQVRLQRGEASAQADRVLLDPVAGLLTLTGQPLLTEGAHRLSGQSIRFWVDADRIECEDCRVVVDGGWGEARAPHP